VLSVVSRAAGAYHEKPAEFVHGQAARLSWVWDRLCFAVPMHEPTSDGLRDLIGGGRPTLAAGTSAWVRDNRGNPAWNGVYGSYYEYPDNPSNDRPSSEFTAYIRCRRNSVSGGDVYGGMFINRYAAADPWVTWSISNDSLASGKMSAGLTVNSVSYDLGNTPTAVSLTEYTSTFLRWRSGEVPRLDVLGERGNVMHSLVGPTVLTGTLTYALNQGLRINASQDPATSEAYYSQAMVWGRRLGDVEMQSLVADPFGWYAPRRETVLLAGPFPIVAPSAVATVAGTSPYSQASITPTINGAGVATSYTVTAGSNQAVNFTRTVSGSTTTDSVPAGTTQAFPTGAAAAADVTYVALDSPDTGV
jgi:hypothetical protein